VNSAHHARRALRCEPLEQRQLLAITVAAFTPTASGFVVEFSDQIETGSLNLYDAENGALGEADVTLEGATVGAVSGALVVEDNELTFVATGGPLAADTYTVTLRSAAGGIVDEALGELLDGEYGGTFPTGNGTAGGDFVYSFAVEAPELLVVSLPDFARGPSQAVQAPSQGSGEELPDGLLVQFSDAEGVTSGTFTITYDPDLLTITAVQAGPDAPSDMLVEANLTEPGVAVISFAIPGDPMASGAANLIEIIAEVPADATYGAVQVLDISDVEINAGAIEATADDAIHAVVFVGDANGNCAYDTEDARLIARVGLELDSGYAIDQPSSTLSDDYEVLFPTVDPAIIGDVTGKEGLSALDASDILRCVTGLDTPNIPEIPDLVAPTASISPNGTSVSTDTILFTITTNEDASVTVSVLENDADSDVSDTLTVGSADSTSSKGATITVNSGGTVTYNPVSSDALNALAEGESATDTFQYTVTDGQGGTASATVTVTVAGRNDEPTANTDAAWTDSTATTDIDVLANDTDPDTSDTLAIASFDATSEQGASVTTNVDGTLHYDPTVSSTLAALESTVTDSFTYTLTDGHSGVAVTGTVTVTLNGSTTSGVTYINLQGSSIAVTGNGATVSGSVVTITSAGTYSISGTLNDGQVIVDSSDEEDVELILNGVDITCSDSAPIYVASAENAVITLADDTQNYITDGTTYTYDSADTDEPDAAIFSNDDLKINGNGSLIVDANYNNGIASKDDLDINGGNITVTAVNHGIRGKDSVVIVDGTVTVNAGGDGIQSNNDEDATKGYVTIEGGTLNITAASDGIQAETTVYITGGDITISAGGGSACGADDTGKGIKGALGVTIDAGTIDAVSIDVDSADDAVHSDGAVTINGGDITLATADDAIHAETAVAINGGDISITTSYEGIDAPAITINDGTIDVVATNDGITAASLDGSSSVVSIYGGTISVTAGTDGIQAEAQLLVTGGTVTVTTGGGSTHSVGSSESAKALKATTDLTIQGGTITIDSSDDAIHTNGSITISGGSITAASADDGIHADSSITIDGGDINITKSYEGIESCVITIDDGTIHVVSSDDGINVAGGADNSGWGGGGGMSANSDNQLYINGGYIVLNAAGDGLDSNGYITITAGTVIVHGPTVSMNGAIDYNGTFNMNGGFLVAVGSSGMAEAPGDSSTLECLSVRYGSTQSAGTMVHIESEGGVQILTFVPEKAYQSVVVCSPSLVAGTTYVVYSGGSSTGTLADGLYTGGTYTAGTELGSITLS